MAIPEGEQRSDSEKEEDNEDSGGGNGSGQENKDEEQQDDPPAPERSHAEMDPYHRLAHGIHPSRPEPILGRLFHVDANISSLVVYVIDMDGQVAPYNSNGHAPIVGPIITNLARSMVASDTPTLGFGVVSGADFGYDPIQVRQAIFDFDAWASIVMNPNATAMLYSALENVNTSYDPMGACQLTYIDSRDDTNWFDFMAPILDSFMTEATSQVGQKWTGMMMKNAQTDANLLRNAAQVPQALSPAIGFSRYNLRPFYPYQIIPSVSIGLIYLIIVSFFSFAFYLPIHFKYLKPEGRPPLKFYQLIIWRWCATISAYFMLSLAYSFVSLAFQVNFSGGDPVTSETRVTSTVDGYTNPDGWGRATFPVYWMLNFFGMIALGLACKNVAMIVGQPWTGLWLIFWVISNVSTAFYDIDIEPHFFYWGYAWPLHSVVEGSRQILFGLHNPLGLDFGILIAWGAVNTALFPLCCLFMRWKSKNGVHEYYK
ncbi:hypothetical protein LTR62_005911 [Meristemomyces frigidus]|uniref:DUF3533 domain-containing protein n=1 Tax=Meristemomyces frigidus TaxID=1508187 RepID=A0AAN7TQK4_9PEZI|nr:hypothetical protein LTR62_005911 [Meristemomyces frigidus]